VVDPTIDDKLRLVELGATSASTRSTSGCPAPASAPSRTARSIAEHIRRRGSLRIKPSCAARTHVNDIQAIVDISQKVGIEIEVLCFIGSSPIRQYAEDWDLAADAQAVSRSAIDLARRHDLPVATSPRTPRARAPRS
jgi:2-isopropylmalate synthase